MADCRRFISNQQLDIRHILAEAQHRWLKPNEVCEILRNHKMFQIQPDPPYKPTGGSMFLFDRKALRYFRKDGHSWRKKKDGKTVREAHEKLKAGSVDVLHCYYAHGEDNDNFQRRSYWMLDSQLEHIVLVHYREIKEGNRSSTSCSDARAESGSSQTCSPSISAKVDSSSRAVQASYPSSPSTGNCNGQTPYSELLADVDSREDLRSSTLAETADTSTSYGWPNISSQMEDRTGFSNSLRHQFGTGFGGMCSTDMSNPPVQSDILSFSRNISIKQEQGVATCQPSTADFITRKLTDAKLDACSLPEDDGKNMLPNTQVQELLGSSRILQEPLTSPNGAQADFGTSENHVESMINGYGKAPVEADSHNDNSGELKKLDSFGRWMNKEIGGDCGDSLMASDSGNFWNAIDTQDDKEVSSLSRHMQLDINSLGPSLSQEQLFSFSDFSPDWAYSGVETKVLITGSFLGDSNRSRNTAWSCMYGEVEVPAEVITDNVLRCQAPLHAPGRVPFYITCSNRLACSEVREFEYREKPSSEMSLAVVSEPEDEMRLLIRLTKLLCLRLNREWLDCSVENCEKCNLKNEILITRSEDDGEWERLKKCSMVIEQNHENPKDILIEKLLKDKLYEWLVCSVHEEGKGPNILDDEGQGIIHLAAALGYEWAIGPIVAAGVNPNFRDVNGRTGLHWAAFYGREETVVALVRLGAAPGAVEDPTSKFPGGRTAADLASNRGHKGIAGYLAEADLTTHLSLLTLKESVMESVNATIAAEKAVEKIEEQNIISSDGSRDGQLSLKGSLAAVRKSAEAAALIQASFRARSFQFRQLTKSSAEVCASSDVVALASLSNKARKMGHFSDYLHGAALKIQQKYRGWKGRKEFIKIRNRIVKIQAHVRGHQVRKQYKKVIWSVSIVEKAILRWRRKGVGLRGFRAGGASGNSLPLTGKHDEYDFLRLGRKQKVAGVEKALSRVQSMVRYPEAREQYMRLATNFQTSKIDREVRGDQNFDKSATDEDLLALASMTC